MSASNQAGAEATTSVPIPIRHDAGMTETPDPASGAPDRKVYDPQSGIATITIPTVERHLLRKVIITLIVLALFGGLGYEYYRHSRPARTPVDHGQASPNGYRSPVNTVIFYLDQLRGGSPGELARAKLLTCPQDIAAGKLSPISGTLRSFKVTDRSSTVDHAQVHATLITSTDSKGTKLVVPLVKDGGKWLVCFTSTVATGGTLPATPLPAKSSSS